MNNTANEHESTTTSENTMSHGQQQARSASRILTALTGMLLCGPLAAQEPLPPQPTAPSEPPAPAPVPAPQEEGEQEPEEGRRRVEIPSLEGQAGPGMEEMQRLFTEIELTLRRIDGMLLDASGGQTGQLAGIEESGLLDLLDEAPQQPQNEGSGEGGSEQDAGAEAGAPQGGAPLPGLAGALQRSEEEAILVLGGIERVLELAAQQQSPGSSGPSSDTRNPMEGQQNNRTDKTGSPENPDQGPQPEGQQDQPSGQDQNPKDPGESEDEGDQQETNQLPGQETESAPPVDPAAERWGELPVHYRDVFRGEGGKGMPAEYRDWIDAYYRRLNQRSGG